jgi:hypothetical protein
LPINYRTGAYSAACTGILLGAKSDNDFLVLIWGFFLAVHIGPKPCAQRRIAASYARVNTLVFNVQASMNHSPGFRRIRLAKIPKAIIAGLRSSYFKPYLFCPGRYSRHGLSRNLAGTLVPFPTLSDEIA